MVENTNYYNNDEAEIDLLGLFFYVLKKWRKLLIFFLVGAVIGCGVSYMKMVNIDPRDPVKMEKYFEKVKPEDLNEELVAQFADYNDLYDEVLAKADDSVILNMDPTAVYTGNISYYITVNNEDIDEISAFYGTLFDREGNWERLLKASGLNCSEAAFKELAWLGFSKTSLDNQILAEDFKIETRGATLSFGVTTPTEASRDAVLAEMAAMANETFKENAKSYKNFSFVQTGNATNFGYSSGVVNAQADYASLKRAYLNEIMTIEKDLSDEELLYYSVNYNLEEFLEDYETGFSKKWPVIAAVALAFVAACWYAVKYILDKHIKSEDEITSQFGLQVLGSVDPRPQAKNGIDRLINRMSDSGQIPANSVEYLSSLIRGFDFDRIALIFDGDDAETGALAGKLLAADDRLVSAGNLLSDDAAAETVKESQSAILLAHLNVVTQAELIRMLELSKKLGREILGTVVIR